MTLQYDSAGREVTAASQKSKINQIQACLGHSPVKYSPNSCSSFMALSKTLLACSYVCLRFISLPHTKK